LLVLLDRPALSHPRMRSRISARLYAQAEPPQLVDVLRQTRAANYHCVGAPGEAGPNHGLVVAEAGHI
jgi:hypothetical protein